MAARVEFSYVDDCLLFQSISKSITDRVALNNDETTFSTQRLSLFETSHVKLKAIDYIYMLTALRDNIVQLRRIANQVVAQRIAGLVHKLVAERVKTGRHALVQPVIKGSLCQTIFAGLQQVLGHVAIDEVRERPLAEKSVRHVGASADTATCPATCVCSNKSPHELP